MEHLRLHTEECPKVPHMLSLKFSHQGFILAVQGSSLQPGSGPPSPLPALSPLDSIFFCNNCSQDYVVSVPGQGQVMS